MFFSNDFVAFNPCEPNRTSACAMPVCRFKIDRERLHPCHPQWRSETLQPEMRDHNQFNHCPLNRSHSSSEMTFTLCFFASVSLEPASRPAITRSVFFETELETLAPSLIAIAFASSLDIVSSVPVKT